MPSGARDFVEKSDTSGDEDSRQRRNKWLMRVQRE